MFRMDAIDLTKVRPQRFEPATNHPLVTRFRKWAGLIPWTRRKTRL